MKLSTKIILPIILISALLILLAGCLLTPTDESPGYTPGTITGIIAAPCCKDSVESAEGETTSPEYWCYYCQETWSLQDGVEVVLTYGEDEVATTTTNDKGEYVFNDVPPGKNYVITALCPDFDDNRPLVKDVALEVASTFNTKTTDLVSTSLGLVVDFLVLYTDWGPEDISLDEVLADRPDFPNFPDFKALVYEVRGIEENCELNLHTDADVLYATCKAAEEISGLDIACEAGFAPSPPGPGPILTPDPCEGNNPPYDVSLVDPSPSVVVCETYSGTVTAKDDDVGDTLTYSWTAGFTPPGDMTITSAGVITWNPGCEDICDDCGPQVRVENGNGIEPCTPNIIKVTVDDGCITVDAEFCIEVTNAAPEISNITNTVTLVAPPAEQYNGTAVATCDATYQVEASDPDTCQTALYYSLEGDVPSGMVIDSNGLITWDPVPCPSEGPSWMVTVKVKDDCDAEDTVTLRVTATNNDPEITDSSITGYNAKKYYPETNKWKICVLGLSTLAIEMEATDEDIIDETSCQSFSFSIEAIDSSSGSVMLPPCYFSYEQTAFNTYRIVFNANCFTECVPLVPHNQKIGGFYLCLPECWWEFKVIVDDGCSSDEIIFRVEVDITGWI